MEEMQNQSLVSGINLDFCVKSEDLLPAEDAIKTEYFEEEYCDIGVQFKHDKDSLVCEHMNTDLVKKECIDLKDINIDSEVKPEIDLKSEYDFGRIEELELEIKDESGVSYDDSSTRELLEMDLNQTPSDSSTTHIFDARDVESSSELLSELSDDPIFVPQQKYKRRNLMRKPKAHSQSSSLKQTRTEKTKFITRYHKSKYSIKCQFCLDTVTNYERHLQRNHQQEKEVKDLLTYPTNTPEGKKMRRKILSLLRNDTNFNQYVSDMDITSNRIPCAQCKRIVEKNYLKIHYKRCLLKSDKKCKRLNHLAASQTLIAFASQPQNNAVTIRVKHEVFSRMLTDEIGNLARTDPLIRYYGEEYLIKHKRAELAIACSNKMRECARLLIELRRRLDNPKLSLIETLNPIIFNDIVLSVKEMSGYNFDTKTYKAPSLANHLRTTLKQISNCALELLSMENPSVKFNNLKKTVKEIKTFKFLVINKWNCEVSPFTIKDSYNEFGKSPIELKSELSSEACSSRTSDDSKISIDGDEADVSKIMKKKKRKAPHRFKWSSQQKSLVLTNFSNYVINKKVPKKGECLALIEKHKDLLSNLDWVRVKILVYNTWRSNK